MAGFWLYLAFGSALVAGCLALRARSFLILF